MLLTVEFHGICMFVCPGDGPSYRVLLPRTFDSGKMDKHNPLLRIMQRGGSALGEHRLRGHKVTFSARQNTMKRVGLGQLININDVVSGSKFQLKPDRDLEAEVILDGGTLEVLRNSTPATGAYTVGAKSLSAPVISVKWTIETEQDQVTCEIRHLSNDQLVTSYNMKSTDDDPQYIEVSNLCKRLGPVGCDGVIEDHDFAWFYDLLQPSPAAKPVPTLDCKKLPGPAGELSAVSGTTSTCYVCELC